MKILKDNGHLMSVNYMQFYSSEVAYFYNPDIDKHRVIYLIPDSDRIFEDGVIRRVSLIDQRYKDTDYVSQFETEYSHSFHYDTDLLATMAELAQDLPDNFFFPDNDSD